jgi:hypothetical protein
MAESRKQFGGSIPPGTADWHRPKGPARGMSFEPKIVAPPEPFDIPIV